MVRGGGFFYPELGVGERYFGIDGGVGPTATSSETSTSPARRPPATPSTLLSTDTGTLGDCRLSAA